MNSRNVERLIIEILKPSTHFDWLSTDHCIGGIIKRVFRLEGRVVEVIMQFLEVDENTAYYIQSAITSSKVGRLNKRGAVEYLRSLN